MAGRIASASSPVTITFDGREITASAGEPLVASLVSAGHLAFARSPKFHRPRGPSCLRAACDGCLARVDGVPNVMTCMVAAREGTSVVSQNTLGPRDLDLLRMTDWFFPQGMNHHELFAGVPGVQQVMQAFARRVAGLGKLPAERPETPERPARRRSADVVVVGSGPSGVSIGLELSRRGRQVEVLDDAVAPGGSLRALGVDGFSEAEAGWRALADRMSGLHFRAQTVVASVYGNDLLVVGPEGAEVVEARDVVLAPGAHDGLLPFEGNDLPGVMSARAALFFLAAGVTVGDRVVVATPAGGGPYGAIYARAFASAAPHATVTCLPGDPVRVRGSGSVREVTVRGPDGKSKVLRADALLVDAPRAPAYELLAQAGADLEHHPYGFRARTDRGKVRDGFWGAGEAVGTPLTPEAIAEEARTVAERIGA